MSENYRKEEETASWDAGEVRRAQAQGKNNRSMPPAQGRKRHPRRRRGINPVIYLLSILVTSAILAGVGWLLLSDLCAFNKDPLTTTVEVTAEDTMGSIATKLKDAGLIKYKWFFRLFAAFSNADEKIGLGTYELNTEMDYRALILGMHSSSGNMNADTVTVTIPEGYTVTQTIKLLASNGVNTEEALMDAAKNATFDYDFIDNDSEDITRLEGYLFPDTYEFYLGHDPEDALDKLINNFYNKLDMTLVDQAKERGYSLHDIITIASLIEKETDGTDRGTIASVIYNRLEGSGGKAGTYGLLQIDASLLYALPDHTGPITETDKATDSPYNLYKNAGLPPTPIANPGLASINAAFEPEETGYYYYALGTDGKHHFFATYEEHLAFVNSSQYGG